MPVGNYYSFIFDVLRDAIFVPLTTSDDYAAGFFWGLVVAVVIGGASRFILWARGLIRAFFNPTKVPATNPGPSGYSRLKGCVFAVFVLFVTVTVLVGAFSI